MLPDQVTKIHEQNLGTFLTKKTSQMIYIDEEDEEMPNSQQNVIDLTLEDTVVPFKKQIHVAYAQFEQVNSKQYSNWLKGQLNNTI
jgi:hypothetical protein